MIRTWSYSVVPAGTSVAVEVEGGFMRTQAPCDGLLAECEDTSVFIPATDILAAARALRKLEKTK